MFMNELIVKYKVATCHYEMHSSLSIQFLDFLMHTRGFESCVYGFT